MAFQDHFSGHAADYARSRPTYPQALFAWISEQCRHHDLAWDVGCGSGQASLALAHHFQRVHASDPSEQQIAAAPADLRVTWRVESAEHCALRHHSVDLVTAAQAYHWFNHERFCNESRRVLRPGGVIALWCYGRTRVGRGVDEVFDDLYENLLGPYWPPERRHVDDGYRHLPFPFEPISDPPRFEMTADWDLAQYLDYLRTWSSSQRFLKETGRDAMSEFAERFAAAWGEPGRRREVAWPLSLRVGRTADD